MSKPQKHLNRDQQEMVNKHVDLVETLARKHRKWESSYRSEYDDLLGEGYLALIEAVLAWKPEIGPFKPYAIRRIKHQFSKADQKQLFPVTVSANAQGLIRAIRNARTIGYHTAFEISVYTGINPDKVVELLPYTETLPSATPVGEVDPEAAGLQAVVVDNAPLPEDIVIANEERDLVRDAVEALPQPHRSIIEARFGFTTGVPMVSSEIQEFLGIDGDVVRAAESEAIIALENILRSAGLHE
jgi:RNA polymerase sigma factor (sigma-70 family)